MKGVIGFVAFRQGSKRLPGKNGLRLGDKTLYQITLDKLVDLKRSGLLQEVVASTDSLEWLAHCGELYGQDILLHNRPAEVSGDFASDTDVILDFFKQQPSYRGCAVLLSLCTYPFMKRSLLKKIVQTHNQRSRSVFALTASHHMPQKLLRLEEGIIRPYLFDQMEEFESNTKVLIKRYPEAYHTTGAFLIGDAFHTLGKGGIWHHDDIGYVVDDSFHLDIDNFEDFELAQLRYDQTKEYE